MSKSIKSSKPKGVVEVDPQAVKIKIPARDVEALLIQHDTSNRVGLTAVVEEIRRMAQEQLPSQFLR